jgi:hypothetical protein
MKKFYYLLFFLTTISFCSFSQETFIYNIGQVQVTVPVNWFYVLNENGSMTIYAPNKELSISFDIMEAKDLDSAYKELSKNSEKSFKDVTLDDPKEKDLNGMQSILITGKANKDKIFISYALIITPNARILSVGTSANLDSSHKNEKEFSELIQSIRPIEIEKKNE